VLKAAEQLKVVSPDVKRRTLAFLKDIVSKCATIAQKKMAENDLEVAQEAINRGKAIEAMEPKYQ
jgi:hypothetical protein